MNDERYQLLPPLSEDEYLALKADIAKRGVLVPVEVDETGEILDGHHRDRIATELGIDVPKIVRSGWTEAQKREHILKVNLLRRQLGPIAWAEAFRKLAVERGISLGQGKRNDRTSANVAEVAAELGVSARTARGRLKLAGQLQDVPELAAAVDAGQLPAQRALRMKRDADARQIRAARREMDAAAAAGQPITESRWKSYLPREVEEWDPADPVPIITAEEMELVPPGHNWQVDPLDADLNQRENYATRPMAWHGDNLLMPTGRWKVAVIRFAGTTDDVVRRWWQWDNYDGQAIRKAANPTLTNTSHLQTTEYLHAERGPGSAWRETTALLEALDADTAALRARLEAGPANINDPSVVWHLAEQVEFYRYRDGVARIDAQWHRFRDWLDEIDETPMNADGTWGPGHVDEATIRRVFGLPALEATP